MRGQRHVPAALYPGKETLPIAQETEWDPGPVWTGAENLTSRGIRTPNRPARSSVAIPTELQGPLNVLNTDLNPICHLVALLGTQHILHVAR